MLTNPQFILMLSGLSGLFLGLLLLGIAKKNNKYIFGLTDWTIGLLLLSLVSVLFLLRGRIPDLFSIVIANVLVLAGFIMIAKGIRNFFETPPLYSKPFIFFSLIVYGSAFLWFTYIDDDLFVRTMLFSISGLLVFTDTLFILFRHLQRGPGVIILIIAMGLMVASRLLRILFILIGYDTPDTIFEESISQLLIFTTPYFAIPIATLAFVVLAYDRLTFNLNQLLRFDELTGCLNKKTFLEEAEREISRALRYIQPTTFLIIDIDNFKAINDQYGHLYGDIVLKKISDQIRQSLRESDTAARFGGDEFLVLLPATKITVAEKISTRIIESIQQQFDPPLSVSIGIAALEDETDSLHFILARADKALYQSKKNGKNRYMVHTDKDVLTTA